MRSLADDLNYQELKDLATSLCHKPKPNRRIQLVMPQKIVDALDREFPKVDRSRLLTLAALEILIRKKRIEHPELESWVSQGQEDLDQLWTYLNERDQI